MTFFRANFRTIIVSFTQWVMFRLGIQDTSDLYGAEVKEVESLDVAELENYKTAVVIHLYYENYLPKLTQALDSYSNHSFFVTCSSEEVYLQIERLKAAYLNLDCRLVPNRGRNFPALFVEYASVLTDFDWVIHLHSKNSPHAKNNVGEIWGRRLWDLLLLNQDLVERISNIVSKNPDIGLVSLDVGDLVGRNNFRWGKSGLLLSKKPWSNLNLKIDDDSSNFVFPVGGMFWARPAALAPLLELKVQYVDFPEELGQVDGAPQHLLERAIGPVSEAQGYRHLVYSYESDSFRIANNSLRREANILED